jgi:hypothetical protein
MYRCGLYVICCRDLCPCRKTTGTPGAEAKRCSTFRDPVLKTVFACIADKGYSFVRSSQSVSLSAYPAMYKARDARHFSFNSATVPLVYIHCCIMRIPFLQPTPQPPTGRHNQVIPDKTANLLDLLSFGWLFPLLKTGYSRTLQEEDVWRLDEAKRCQNASDRLERYFYARCPSVFRPAHLVADIKVCDTQVSGWDPEKESNKEYYPVVEGSSASEGKEITRQKSATWASAVFFEWRLRRKYTQVKLGNLFIEVDEKGVERF